MYWEAIGAIGQAVSAFALVVVIVQIRHARTESRRALGQGRLEALRDLFALASEARIARLTVHADSQLGAAPGPFDTALMTRAGMSPEDAQMYAGYQAAFWNYQLHVLANIDELSASERAAFEMGIRLRYRPSSVGRLYYETMKPLAHPDVVRYIESVLAQRPG